MTVLLDAVPFLELSTEEVGGAFSGLLIGNIRSARRRMSRLLFDRRYGVETSEFAHLDRFGLAHHERVYYSPANWGTLRRALPAHEVCADDVFVDLGSGKARMVLEAAARFPFRKVIGVELTAELTEVARANLDVDPAPDPQRPGRPGPIRRARLPDPGRRHRGLPEQPVPR